jgi:hypothetical protein
MKSFVRCFVFAGWLTTILASPVWAEGPGDMFRDGTFTGEMRYRYEFVDQDGPAPVAAHATAGTLRANIGFKTAPYQGFQSYLEAQMVQNVGANDFNDTVNGKTRHPVVADPDNKQINQAWLAWNGMKELEIKAGRQIINLDNQRFIGSVDWRQNDQTFDSLLLRVTGIKNANFSYGHIGKVKRVFGDDNPLGSLRSDSHFINSSYTFSDAFKLTGYAYWLDFDRLATRSSRTYGLRATGAAKIAESLLFSYEAEAANQSDHGNNTANYNENYFHIAPSISMQGWTLTSGYELLGGNGTSSFQTPLATLHKFNGWADKFLDTPAAGLEDAYVGVTYKFTNDSPLLNGISMAILYHDFSGDDRGDFGSEFDASISKSFALPKNHAIKKLMFTAKYADYNADDAPYTDTQKAWFQIGLSF